MKKQAAKILQRVAARVCTDEKKYERVYRELKSNYNKIPWSSRHAFLERLVKV